SPCAAGERTIDPLLIIARTFHYAASASLEGTFVLWCAIVPPALRRSRAAGLTDRRLAMIAWASMLVAFVSGVAWLVATASQMSSLPPAAVIDQGVAGIVLTQTRFGADWLFRAACLVVLAFVLALRARWIGLVVAAAFVVSLAWAGHGAAADDLPLDFLHLPADLVHLLAT